MPNPISSVSYQSSSSAGPDPEDGGMCESTPENASFSPESPASETLVCADPGLDEEAEAEAEFEAGAAEAWEDPPFEDPEPYTTFRGKAQQGELSARVAANGGAEGASGFSDYLEAPSLDEPGGGHVFSGDVGGSVLGLAGGVQGAVVYDEDCGFGVVVALNYGGEKNLVKGGSGALLAGYSNYEGSFDEYDKSTQLALTGGDGIAGSARLNVDGKGEVVGQGMAVGLGAGLSVSGTQSHPLLKYFPECPEE